MVYTSLLVLYEILSCVSLLIDHFQATPNSLSSHSFLYVDETLTHQYPLLLLITVMDDQTQIKEELLWFENGMIDKQ